MAWFHVPSATCHVPFAPSPCEKRKLGHLIYDFGGTNHSEIGEKGEENSGEVGAGGESWKDAWARVYGWRIALSATRVADVAVVGLRPTRLIVPHFFEEQLALDAVSLSYGCRKAILRNKQRNNSKQFVERPKSRYSRFDRRLISLLNGP